MNNCAFKVSVWAVYDSTQLKCQTQFFCMLLANYKLNFRFFGAWDHFEAVVLGMLYYVLHM